MGEHSLGKQVFKEMVHFKPKDNLSLAQAMIFFFLSEKRKHSLSTNVE